MQNSFVLMKSGPRIPYMVIGLKYDVFLHISGSTNPKVFSKGSLKAKFDPLTDIAGDVIITLQ